MTVEGYNEEIGGTAISRSIWTWARLAGGAAILAVLVWRVGAGPFVDGLRLTTAWALAAAVAITSLTTLCCAWRWSLVAGGLGVDVPLRTAVSAYYRSQFLNSTLPGGVLGDVHRGVLHGRAVGDRRSSCPSVAPSTPDASASGPAGSAMSRWPGADGVPRLSGARSRWTCSRIRPSTRCSPAHRRSTSCPT